jgi:erythromycin esterase-like protein
VIERRRGAGAEQQTEQEVVSALREAKLPMDRPEHWDPLLDRIGDARVVLLGEASHGTHEFYALRAELTRRLIVEKGFSFVAVEADWPDTYRVNRWVQHAGHDATAREALSDFERFPLWMWRNAEVVTFLEWLRAHDAGLPPARRVGFYGLDLYSLYTSIEAVLGYLDRVDPVTARQARRRYACLDSASLDPQEYALQVRLGLRPGCQREVIEQLVELRRQSLDYLTRDGLVAEDEQLFAEQNAQLIVDAEEYYREMFGRHVNTWNLRDRHMVRTLAALLAHHERRASPAKAVVWAHNSHVGDARATERTAADELNVGQLAREQLGEHDTVLVGFTTNSGWVTAASDWGAAMERKRVRPALPGSIEAVCHATGWRRFLLPLWSPRARDALREPRLERAIGVIYRPDTERLSHYFHCSVPDQFDALVHVDVTRALEPLDLTSQWEAGEPETFPTGL